MKSTTDEKNLVESSVKLNEKFLLRSDEQMTSKNKQLINFFFILKYLNHEFRIKLFQFVYSLSHSKKLLRKKEVL
jgi:hypothetical protein